MTGSQRVVLLGCGSFNPPTNMHLRMFEIARDFLHRTTNFNVVAGLMSPVHDKYGKEGLLNATERIQMVKLALGNKNWIHVSDWEAHQSGWIPTREVLQHHQDTIDTMVNGNVDPIVKRQRLDGNDWLGKLAASTEPVQLKLLCGADLLESFGKPGLWKDEDIEAIVGKFGLVVITREGSNPYKFIYESDVLTKYQRNIHIVTEWITNEVSSTKIRRALKRGESVRYLVQDAVIDFIYNHALYNTHNNIQQPPQPCMSSVKDLWDRIGCVSRALVHSGSYNGIPKGHYNPARNAVNNNNNNNNNDNNNSINQAAVVYDENGSALYSPIYV